MEVASSRFCAQCGALVSTVRRGDRVVMRTHSVTGHPADADCVGSETPGWESRAQFAWVRSL